VSGGTSAKIVSVLQKVPEDTANLVVHDIMTLLSDRCNTR